MATAKVTEIADEAAFHQYTSGITPSTLLVIYFHAPWAAPCKQMSEVLKTLASTYPDDKSVEFVSLNAEELPEVSESYDVTAVPYIVLNRSGKVLETVSGSDPIKVRDAVERHASKSGNPETATLPPPQTVTRPAYDSANGSATKNISPHDPAAGAAGAEPELPAGEADKDALFKRLDELTKAAPVMLFMKGTPSAPQCGFSRQTVGMLRERSIRYGFFNILADDDVRQGLKEYADWPTFPQLWVNGELVGGLDIVREEFENDPDFLMEYSVKAAAPAA